MNKRTRLQKDIFYTFDIETTTIITGIDELSRPIRQGIIWSGQFYDGGTYTQVRSLKETVAFLKSIEDRAKNSSKIGKIVIFVHNLSYEFQFIKNFFHWDKIMATSKRKIISAESDYLVFRCSYMLSNMSLSRFLKNENVPSEFLKSDMDYLKVRYPWTKISHSEYVYCRNDVVGLHIALSNRIAQCKNSDINNLPLTSTGYVRKDCRNAINSNRSNRYRFEKNAMDLETFKMCHQAFRGGNTHANKMYSNKILHNLAGRDIASSYIFDEMCWKYPTRFHDIKCYTKKEFDFFRHNWQDWGMLIEVSFKNLRLKNDKLTPVPYISISKCVDFYLDSTETKNLIDNGRLISTGNDGYAHMIITEIDYNIIETQYEWESELFGKIKYAKKKPLPDEFKQQIMTYFYNKTTKKSSDNYTYMRAKALLNSTFGMTVTYPLKPHFIFDDIEKDVIEESESEQELLDEFYNSPSSFLDYQIGVWITAYARLELQWAIDLLVNKKDQNKSDLVYCDTDSVKYLNPEDHEEDLNNLNKKIEEIARKNNAFCNFNEKDYVLGIFEDDGHYDKFITYGAKKYIYGNDEDFHITIAGVPKGAGENLIKSDVKNGKLNSPFDVKKGYKFSSVKLASVYNDLKETKKYEVDGHNLEYSSNVALYPTSYLLGMGTEYEQLLDLYKDYIED